jgi:hypothetical protein
LASSTIDHDSGRVVITASGSAGYPVGMTFYVIGSAATYAIPPADWAVRLLTSQPSNGHGRAYGVGVSSAKAEMELAIAMGLIDPSLVEEPAEPDAPVLRQSAPVQSGP